MVKQLKVSSRRYSTRQRVSNKIEKLINEKHTAYQSYIQNGENKEIFEIFQTIQNMLLSAIEASKQQYYSKIMYIFKSCYETGTFPSEW